MLVGGAQIPAPAAKRDRLKEMVMDKLIERELLATEADRLGYVVTDDEVEDQIGESKIIGLGDGAHRSPAAEERGVQLRLLQELPPVRPGRDAQELHRGAEEGAAGGARARSAARRRLVSTDEVKADFIRRGRQVNLEYLRFAGQPLSRTTSC